MRAAAFLWLGCMGIVAAILLLASSSLYLLGWLLIR